MSNEKLIEIIIQYNALYDISHPKCLEGQYKKNIEKYLEKL